VHDLSYIIACFTCEPTLDRHGHCCTNALTFISLELKDGCEVSVESLGSGGPPSTVCSLCLPRFQASQSLPAFRLETIEGKAFAIDSSIWIYQFQATMRDKDGRALVNAHVLGFLRRICKLLFYGIRPVFVFDGGAPVLKRNTIVRQLTFHSSHC